MLLEWEVLLQTREKKKVTPVQRLNFSHCVPFSLPQNALNRNYGSGTVPQLLSIVGLLPFSFFLSLLHLILNWFLGSMQDCEYRYKPIGWPSTIRFDYGLASSPRLQISQGIFIFLQKNSHPWVILFAASIPWRLFKSYLRFRIKFI